MGHRTDIILTTALEDGGLATNISKLNPYLRKVGHMPLTQVGGFMDCDVYMNNYKMLVVEDFVAQFKTIEWENPECVQLLIKDENDDLFTVYLPNNR